MSMTDGLIQGSFKGVPFLVSRMSLLGGIKFAKHTFVNNANQNIEPLGKRQRTYDLTLIINSGSDDEQYYANRRAILGILEEGGKGTLNHPTEGIIQDMVAVSFGPLVENFDSIGRASLNVTFELSFDEAAPEVSQLTITRINQAKDDLADQMSQNIEDNYEVSTSFSGNFTSAAEKLNGVTDEFNEKTKFLSQTSESIDEVNAAISSMAASINTLVQNPTELANSINNIYFSVNGAYNSVTATFEVMKGFFGFGDSDVEINPTTAGLTQRKQNNDLVNQQMQIAALSYAYLNAAQIDFGTVNNLEVAADELEDQFQKVIDSDGMNQDTKNSLRDMRSITERFFDQQKVTLNQIITVFTTQTSARLLSYQYYGESTTGPALATLNNTPDVRFIKGDVEILTE